MLTFFVEWIQGAGGRCGACDYGDRLLVLTAVMEYKTVTRKIRNSEISIAYSLLFPL